MSHRAQQPADTSDLFDRANAARIEDARRRVRLARATRGGVKHAQQELQKTVQDILREELGKRHD